MDEAADELAKLVIATYLNRKASEVEKLRVSLLIGSKQQLIRRCEASRTRMPRKGKHLRQHHCRPDRITSWDILVLCSIVRRCDIRGMEEPKVGVNI